ncbi:MAG TPA: alpha/beta fold hydrolase [Candidatus Binataceae bacterium]|nr:alpha/beta fold hydrolase [Candidatus Binataceae bacterium]
MSDQAREKNIAEIKQSLRERLKGAKAPFAVTDEVVASAAIERLTSRDGEHWGSVWEAAGDGLYEAACAHEAAGRREQAREAFLKAYGLYQTGRYPVPNHPKKLACYEKSLRSFIRAGIYFDPPLEAIELPFPGRAGEGSRLPVHVRRRRGAKQPVLLHWGGIDGWKEEGHPISELFLAQGFATVALDMPGTGQAPLPGSLDAQRQFVTVLDWIATQAEFDPSRVAILGRSYGGYWATKVAHCYPERVAAAVNWGGGVHHFFQPQWVMKSQFADSYLMDLAAARARSVGASSSAEYAERVKAFSLLEQGVLDRNHAPILVVNGRDDRQVPVEDVYLLLEHGEPKAVRLFPGGHMGHTPQTLPTIVNWIRHTAGA